MTTPPGGVLALAEALGLGRIQDLFNSPPHARGGFGFCGPDRLQDRQHVVGGGDVHWLRPQRREITIYAERVMVTTLEAPST